MKLAVLVACYNRVETTLRNLATLHKALSAIPLIEFKFFLLDDASPDGTGAKVRDRFPDVVVIEGTGNLFWNRGMRWAHAAAREHGSFDAYLLFNDDVSVYPDKVVSFISEVDSDQIMVGATIGSDRISLTYSGMRSLSKFRPLAFQKVVPNGELQACDTFNGNFVFVPAALLDKLGGLDPHFVHAFGDIDLGLTARAMDYPVFLWRSAIGVCDLNPPKTKGDHQNFLARLSEAFSGKQDPSSHVYFLFKHGRKWLFPLFLFNVFFARLRAVLSK